MKILKLILIFFAFMILGFVLFMAFSRSEFKFTVNDKIHADKAEVYYLLTDTAHLKDWRSGIVSFNMIAGNPGEEGSELELTYRSKDKEQEVTISEKLTEVKKNHSLLYQVNAPRIFKETRTILLSDSADWVNISVTREVKAENWLVKFFISQLSKSLPMETQSELNGLKQLISDRGPSQL